MYLYIACGFSYDLFWNLYRMETNGISEYNTTVQFLSNKHLLKIHLIFYHLQMLYTSKCYAMLWRSSSMNNTFAFVWKKFNWDDLHTKTVYKYSYYIHIISMIWKYITANWFSHWLSEFHFNYVPIIVHKVINLHNSFDIYTKIYKIENV